jgi:hypothetical protein
MYRVIKFVNAIKAAMPVFEAQRAHDEAYLAESVDIFDVERRMREIEVRGENRSQAFSLLAGFR